MRLGIFGGTFNPPHNGHLTAAETACRLLGLDRVLFIPAALPPHKPLPEGTPEPGIRLRLTEAAVAGLPWAGVSGMELARTGASYTADTVDAMARETPNAQLWLLVGSDNFLGLHTWHQPERIFDRCTVAAFKRDDEPEEPLQAQQAMLAERYGARTAILPHDPVVISSTELRALIARGEGREYVPDRVWELMKALGLYGMQSNG